MKQNKSFEMGCGAVVLRGFRLSLKPPPMTLKFLGGVGRSQHYVGLSLADDIGHS